MFPSTIKRDELRNGVAEEAHFDFSWIINLLDEKESASDTRNNTEHDNDQKNGLSLDLLHEQIPDIESTHPERHELNVWSSYQDRMRHESSNRLNTISPFGFDRAQRIWAKSADDVVNCEPQPTYSLWPKQQFLSTYATMNLQHLGEAFFFVESTEVNWTLEGSVEALIKDPNNNAVSFHVEKENFPNSHRYILSFRTIIPGFYTISVRSGSVNSRHIKGSPFFIPVSRNYRLPSPRRAVSFLARAVKAWGVSFCPINRKIYVTDRDAHKVIVYYEDGKFYKCFGSQGSEPGQLYRPCGITVDIENQRLVISDKDNHRICLYTLEGDFISCFGNKGHKNGEFTYPWGVAVSSKKKLIAVADSRNHRIQFFVRNGVYLRKYSVFETNPFEFKSKFNYPRGLVFDKNADNIFVTDFNVQDIFKINIELTSRTTITPIGIALSRPQGITIDQIGNIIVCDSRNNCIRVISASGEHISTISGHITNSFYHPQDVSILSNGDILVVDASSTVRIL